MEHTNFNSIAAAKSPQYTIPHIYSSFITPFLKLFHWLLLVPNVISYDVIKAVYSCKAGGASIRYLSYIWLFLGSIYVVILGVPEFGKPYSITGVVGKLIWIFYALFDVEIIRCLRKNGDKIAELLTKGDQIARLCEQCSENVNINRSRKVSNLARNIPKYVVIVACIFSVLYAFSFVFIVITELIALTTNVYDMFLQWTISKDFKDFTSMNNCTTARCSLLEVCKYSMPACGLLTVWFVVSFGVEIIWVIFLLLTTSFGYYFKRLLNDCINVIEQNQTDILQGIKLFIKITLLVDEFNKLFGTALLWIVTGSILCISVMAAEFIVGSNGDFAYNIVNLFLVIIFLGMLYTGSELHNMGQQLPIRIKGKLFNLNVVNTGDHTQMFQLIQAVGVVQYDALSNSIGMKGNGFFTISYVFVTSLAGIIITYSLVAVQYKLGDIKVEI